METLDAIKKRESIRGYESKQIEQDKLDTILESGKSAPNAGPFQITVIQDQGFLKEINDTTKKIMLGMDGFFKERASLPGYEPMYGAPTMLVLSAPEGDFDDINVSASATIMILAATDLGLGSCFCVSPIMALSDEKLCSNLDLPDGFKPICGVLLGYSNGMSFPSDKPEMDNINYIK